VRERRRFGGPDEGRAEALPPVRSSNEKFLQLGRDAGRSVACERELHAADNATSVARDKNETLARSRAGDHPNQNAVIYARQAAA